MALNEEQRKKVSERIKKMWADKKKLKENLPQIISIDELSEIPNETDARKNLRMIFINARKQNPIAWENDKARLLKQLNDTTIKI